MIGKLRIACVLLLLLALGIDFLHWTGLGEHPRIGAAVSSAAEGEAAPLVLLYLHVGSALLDPLGQHATAVAFVDARYPVSAIDHIADNAAAALHLVMQAMPGWLRTAHYAPPLLLLAIGILAFVQPRQVRTFSSRRR